MKFIKLTYMSVSSKKIYNHSYKIQYNSLFDLTSRLRVKKININ